MDAATEARVNTAYQELAPHFEQWETIKDMIDQLIDITVNLRQSGHPGGSRSKVHTVVATLLSGVMRYDLRHPEKRFGDRFIFAGGHVTPLLYSTLAVINEALRIKYAADRRPQVPGPRRRRARRLPRGPGDLPPPRGPLGPRRDGGQDPLPQVQQRPLGPRPAGRRRRGPGPEARRRRPGQGHHLRRRGRLHHRRHPRDPELGLGPGPGQPLLRGGLERLRHRRPALLRGDLRHARRPGSAPTAGAPSAPSRAASGSR